MDRFNKLTEKEAKEYERELMKMKPDELLELLYYSGYPMTNTAKYKMMFNELARRLGADFNAFIM